VALLLDSAFGVAPVDAVFSGISRMTGISVGTALIAACIVLVLMAWALGVKPGLGTVISFFGIGLAVDATTWVLEATGWSVSENDWQIRLAGLADRGTHFWGSRQRACTRAGSGPAPTTSSCNPSAVSISRSRSPESSSMAQCFWLPS
jgi:hypothetical protein